MVEPRPQNVQCVVHNATLGDRAAAARQACGVFTNYKRDSALHWNMKSTRGRVPAASARSGGRALKQKRVRARGQGVDRKLGSRVPAHGGRVPAHGEARRAQDEAEYLRMEELEHEQKLERERKDEAEYLEYLDGVPGQIYFEVLGGVSVT